MIIGYVVNNSGRSSHIFKRNMPPGGKVSIEDLYNTYRLMYKYKFDINFVEWLQENKLKEGYDIIVEDVIEDTVEEVFSLAGEEILERKEEEDVELDEAAGVLAEAERQEEKWTSVQIAQLKMKDKPRRVIRSIDSIVKLRRAITLCKKEKGKKILIDMIRDRIAELQRQERSEQ